MCRSNDGLAEFHQSPYCQKHIKEIWRINTKWINFLAASPTSQTHKWDFLLTKLTFFYCLSFHAPKIWMFLDLSGFIICQNKAKTDIQLDSSLNAESPARSQNPEYSKLLKTAVHQGLGPQMTWATTTSPVMLLCGQPGHREPCAVKSVFRISVNRKLLWWNNCFSRLGKSHWCHLSGVQ